LYRNNAGAQEEWKTMREYMLHQAEACERTFAFAAVRRVLGNWWKRRTLRRLQDLDDHLLFDIGLTRDEIDRALRLPLSIDPVQEFSRRRIPRGVRLG
jgi:uncharacterized protein YjiS (DUF1127 family)